jgi:hypothetical protein
MYYNRFFKNAKYFSENFENVIRITKISYKIAETIFYKIYFAIAIML